MDEFETVFRYQKYHAVNKWFTRHKRQADGGTMIQRSIQLTESGTARHILPYERTPISVADSMDEITAPWVLADQFWVTNRDEMLRNRGRSKFIDHVKARRIDAMKGLANMLEAAAFGVPVSATDKRNPYGLKYWISQRETNDDGQGFDAYRVRFANGSTAVSKGGIDGSATEKAMWRNYAATYTGINEDFFSRMRRMATLTNFEPPDMVPTDNNGGPTNVMDSNLAIYCGIDEYQEIEDKLTKNNDNYGPDAAPFHGRAAFRRVVFNHAPMLDSETWDPIYFVNHDHFFPYILADEWMIEDGPMRHPEQHRTFVTHINCSYNIFCDNVRMGGSVMHKLRTS